MSPTCRKLPFETERAALDELQNVIRRAMQGERHRLEVRAYRCPSCGSWHLTSEHARDGSGRLATDEREEIR